MVGNLREMTDKEDILCSRCHTEKIGEKGKVLSKNGKWYSTKRYDTDNGYLGQCKGCRKMSEAYADVRARAFRVIRIERVISSINSIFEEIENNYITTSGFDERQILGITEGRSLFIAHKVDKSKIVIPKDVAFKTSARIIYANKAKQEEYTVFDFYKEEIEKLKGEYCFEKFPNTEKLESRLSEANQDLLRRQDLWAEQGINIDALFLLTEMRGEDYQRFLF